MSDRNDPVLPPLYSAIRLGAQLGSPRKALLHKAGNLPEGTLLWSDANGRLALALLLDSETGFEESAPVALVAVLAMGDAIGALAPPVVAVTNAWPDRIEVNGALVGGTALHVLPGGRLLLETEVLVSSAGEYEPGEKPEFTSLHEEGCGEVTPVGLLESFARHFLSWLHRWQEDGFAPLRFHWLARGPRRGVLVTARMGNQRIEGKFKDVGSSGELILECGGGERRLSLAEGLAAGPTWSLP
jgi:biotin-(acetyl-CoA carboxylase) ligase